jgi:hypothetical protein
MAFAEPQCWNIPATRVPGSGAAGRATVRRFRITQSWTGTRWSEPVPSPKSRQFKIGPFDHARAWQAYTADQGRAESRKPSGRTATACAARQVGRSNRLDPPHPAEHNHHMGKVKPSLGERILSWQGLLVALIAATGAVLAAWIGVTGDGGDGGNGGDGGDGGDGGESGPVLQVSSVTFDRVADETLLLQVRGTHFGLPEPRDIYAVAAPTDGSSVRLTPRPEDLDIPAICADEVDQAACEGGVTHSLELCALEGDQDSQDSCVDDLLAEKGVLTTVGWLTGLARESGASWAASITVPQRTALPLTVTAVYIRSPLPNCEPGADCGGEPPIDAEDLERAGPDIADGSSPAVTSPSAPD